ncbi:tRNA-dependent cyclodipeptide synthase [Bartonella sp. AA1HLJMS]|uniref:tRNA-dependent cyclodipeptide synthase n=2 Tax=Bartonella TaxID=773 RepID=UPI0035CF5054
MSLQKEIDVMNRLSFSIRGQSENCSRLIAMKQHLMIGISPFNTRFSEKYITELICWAAKKFKDIDVLLPDIESAMLLILASGSTKAKAERKTKKELNRIRRILYNIHDSYNLEKSFRILDFSQYKQNENYKKLKLKAIDLYKTNQKFSELCTKMSIQAVERRAKSVGLSIEETKNLETTNISLEYIFDEIPFYVNSPSLLNRENSVLAYHREWPVGELLLNGEQPLCVDKQQGHGIVSICTQTYEKNQFMIEDSGENE